MCGIAGYVTQTPNSDSDAILDRMTHVIRHRGPDANGRYRDAHAALGHRRLSIVDLAAGAQPMANEDETLWLTYNGEIFNHADLRPELERACHRCKAPCDTETILHAYEEYGPACVSRFRGMFAFAIWDTRARTLFVARDRLGIKPLYYYSNGSLFAFASEIKALLEHPAISAELEESALPEYLAFGYGSGDRTLFRGIRKLMPGHHLTLEAGHPRIERYWDVPEAAAEEDRDDASWIAECRRRLEETVRMRLMSDVPLGMFLSGGVDSSALAALMKGMVAGPIQTFSVGYRESADSELGFARTVAEHLGTEHREIMLGRDEFFDALPRLVWHEDEPITWPSSVSLYFVSRLASQHVKVVLTGEGSDEIFAGYSRYAHYFFNRKWMDRYRAVPEPVRRRIRRWTETSPLLSGPLRRKLGHTFLGQRDCFESLHLENFYGAFTPPDRERLFGRGGLRWDTAYDNTLAYWEARPEASTLSRLLYTDQKTYLVELLMKQDQMSMATSIESRVPLLDHLLVEFAARVPDRLKIRDGVGKYIFKKAVEDLLPHSIVHRTKMGFPTPLRRWLQQPPAPLLARLRSGAGLLGAYVDRAGLDRLLEDHMAGRVDGTERIWRLLNLQVWGELFLSGNRLSPGSGLLREEAGVPR